MTTRHHIIYIPGLGDTGPNLLSQRAAIIAWHVLYGISTQVVRVQWADTHEGFDDKLQRIVTAVDAAKAKGYRVSLVAASAGASMAVNAFAKRPDDIASVVSIVGAHGPTSHASQATLAANPVLRVSLDRQPSAIRALAAPRRGHILGVKPLSDVVIRLDDMNIPDINYIKLSTHGHVATIAAALTIYSHKLIAFIKRSA